MFSMMVVALKTGFYGDQKRYPAGLEGAKGGLPFEVGDDIFRYDAEGRVLCDDAGAPILPMWMEPVGSIPPLEAGTPIVRASDADIKKWAKPAPPPRRGLPTGNIVKPHQLNEALTFPAAVEAPKEIKTKVRGKRAADEVKI